MLSLKSKLQNSDKRLSCAVCTIPSATVTQALAASGLDALIIDLEHGAVDYGSAHAMIAATAVSDCAPLVRVAQNDPAEVKRALDLGAEGIVFPLIRTAQDAADAVASLRYRRVGHAASAHLLHNRGGIPPCPPISAMLKTGWSAAC